MVNIDKIKKWYIRKELELKDIRQTGVLLYFYDVKNFESFYLESLEVVYTHEQTNEIFLLDKPAFYEKGQPVFIVLRGYPLSITFEFKSRKIDNSTYEYLYNSLNENSIENTNDSQIENVKKAFSKKSKALDSNDEIISLENGCTSFELASKLDSIYTEKIFAKKKLDKKYYVFSMCLFLLGCLITYLLCKIYLPPVIVKEYIYLPI